MHEIDEINKYLDENLHNNILQSELAIQIIFNGKTVGSNTVKDLKDFNSQSLSTQAKKGKQMVSLMPAIKKAFDLMVDDIVELITENECLEKKNGSHNEKWLEEPKAKLIKQINDR